MRILLFALLLLADQSWAAAAPAAKQVKEYTKKHLPTTGVIRQQGNFVYVDVDNAYIHKILPLIKKYGFTAPPYFGKGLVGAHITLIGAQEMEKLGIARITEIGKRVRFNLGRCRVEKPPFWKTVSQVYFIEVNCPYLTKLRAKYGLPKIPLKFHITIGIKPQVIHAKN